MQPMFFAAYMASKAGRAYFLSCAKQTTNLASINKSQLAAMPMPVPSIGEQRKIAEILDSIDGEISASVRLIAKHEELWGAAVRSSMQTGLSCFRDAEAFELHSGVRRSTGSWSLVPLGTVLSGIDAGHSPDLEDTPAGPDPMPLSLF
jgi:type I restriction enzyme, S subunit